MGRIKLEDVAPEVTPPLHVKYRPAKLSEVYGQAEVVRSLSKALSAGTRPHAFLFTGPAGTGKTTLARLVGSSLGVHPSNVIEVDAASNTGIDAMRDVLSTLHYQGFGDVPDKLVIVDECHALSKAAWQSMLKAVEEPPAHVYFAFCTTENGKVPETIVTRCLNYALRSLSRDDILDLLEYVNAKEEIELEEDVVEELVKYADGSPRKLLTGLAAVHDCRNAKEAATVLAQPFESHEVIELCQALVKGNLKWSQVTAVLKACKDDDPESFRLIIVNYLQAVLLNAKDEKQVVHLLECLSYFMKPTNRSEKMAPILLAFGNIVYPA